jgi:hypothetical protein
MDLEETHSFAGLDFSEIPHEWGLDIEDLSAERVSRMIWDKFIYSEPPERLTIIADMVDFLRKLSENESALSYSVIWEALIQLAEDTEHGGQYVFVQVFTMLLPLMWV